MIKLKTAKRRSDPSEGEAAASSASSSSQQKEEERSSAARKSPRRKDSDLVLAAANVQFEDVEVIGEESKAPLRRRLSKSSSASASSGSVKKKGRGKRGSGASLTSVRAEVGLWRARLADSRSDELLAKIEEQLDALALREPALLGKPSSSSSSSSSSASGLASSKDPAAHPARVAALQRLCRRWLQRREALRQPEARAVRDRLRVWDAFIASEKKYFLTLLTIVQKCMRPLMAAAPQQVTEETLVEIFGSLPEIKDQSKTLLSKLRAGTNGAQWISSTALGSLFLNEVMPVMKNYVLYVVEYPKRMQTLARLLRKVPELRSVLDKGEKETVFFCVCFHEKKKKKKKSSCCYC
jgi:hypothetical protein